MGYKVFCLVPFLALLAVPFASGSTSSSCPTGGLLNSWVASNFLYMVYDQVQGDGKHITTSHVSLDVVGGFSNQPFHCEAKTPFFLGNSTNTESIQTNCTTNSTTEYNMSLQYKPGNWNLLTLRETTVCRANATQL